MNGKKSALVVGVLLAILLLGSVSVVWAAPTAADSPVRWRQVGLQGEVRAIDGTVITVSSRWGRVTLFTDDSTRFHLPENDQGGLADVKIGDRVAARGRLVGVRIVRARVIFVIPEGTRILRGTVGQIVDDIIHLVIADDEMPVLTDDNTRVFIPEIQDPTVQDLETGDRVVVVGRPDNEGNFLARAVKAFTDRKLAHLLGEVTSVGAKGFHLTSLQGELTVRVDDQTRFRIPGVQDPSLNNLSVGTKALVTGFWNDDGSALAKIVAALPKRPRRVVGQITAISEMAVTLELRSGIQFTVETDEQTRLWMPGVEKPVLYDLEIGQMIGAAGHWEEDGKLRARFIIARRTPPLSPENDG